MSSSTDTRVPEAPPPSVKLPGHVSGLRSRHASPPPPSFYPQLTLHAVAGCVLALTHPLFWSGPSIPLWTPAIGFGLALIAWLGLRAIPALAGAAIVVVGRQAFRGELAGATWAAAEGVLLVGEPLLAWFLYHYLARGGRQLADPRSAIMYVFLVPGLTASISALARLPLAMSLLEPDSPAMTLLARLWLDRSLALALACPPLLVILTPWLARRGISRPDNARERLSEDSGAVASATEGAAWGDWLETIGLSLGAGILCLLISRMHARQELLGWQLWGVQVLLIVWASTRQGLRGGTLAAAASATFPLMFLQLWPPGEARWLPLLQAHLLVQGCAALLVAAASSWARMHESGYRQVVSHIPVVIYSARLQRDGPAEVVLVSIASRRLLGCPPEELLGEHSRWLAKVHPEDRELVRASLEQLRRQNAPVTVEYRLAESANRPGRWLRDTLAPHRDEEGELIGWEGIVTDITEQRVLADDLRRTTSMFHALVSNLPAGVFFVQGPHGSPILVNARARQLLGQREDTSAGLDQISRAYRLFRANGTLYPVEELPVWLALKEGRTTMRDDIVVHRPDGRRVPLVTWAAPVQLGSKGTDAAVWVLEDLTSVHQAEAARQDTEGRLHAVIDSMAEGMLVHNVRGVIVNCNPAACAFFGMPPERLRGKSVSSLGWEYRRENLSTFLEDDLPFRVVLRTGRPIRNLLMGAVPANATPSSDSGRIPGAMIRWVLVNAVPLVGPSGVAGVVTTFSDITQYIQARDAIRVSEARFRGLVESLPLMVILANRDMRLTYLNPASTDIAGYTMEEISDSSIWTALIHPEDQPRVMEMYRHALDGQPDRCEMRYRAKDGSMKAGVMLIQPRMQEDEVIGVLILILDVTRERKLELGLQRTQRLELIGRLSSGVAHDFNNLLGVVLNLADLARSHIPPGHPAYPDLRRITEASEQAVGLATQLVAFSRNRATQPRPVKLNEVARRTLDLLRATLPASVQVEASLDESGPVISGDETQLQQVLMNLCLNARDAMPGGGILKVRTLNEANTVCLEVEDSGEGMAVDELGRIFEPFYSTKEGGTGLGLAVVQQIVEAFHGTIRVESEPGLGSKFVIRLPGCGG